MQTLTFKDSSKKRSSKKSHNDTYRLISLRYVLQSESDLCSKRKQNEVKLIVLIVRTQRYKCYNQDMRQMVSLSIQSLSNLHSIMSLTIMTIVNKSIKQLSLKQTHYIRNKWLRSQLMDRQVVERRTLCLKFKVYVSIKSLKLVSRMGFKSV